MTGTGNVTGSALSGVSNVDGKNKALSKFIKDQQKSLNDILKNNGKGIIDFDKKENEFKTGLTASITKAALKDPTNAMALYNQLSGGEVPSVDDKNALAKTLPPKLELLKPTTENKEVKKEEEKKETFNFNEIKETKEEGALLANGMREGKHSDKYDFKGNEIHKDSTNSIFQIITIRYMKSGYSKLFEEER